MIRYIESVWDNQKFLLRQGGFYSKPVDVDRGCTQGDVDSPIIFNIIIDAVLRKWKKEERYGGSRAMFYADDGLIENNNNKCLQRDLTNIIKLFELLGLKTNESKTKFMVVRGPEAPKALKQEAYNRMKTGEGKSYLEKRKEEVECSICRKRMKGGSIKRHMLQQHGKETERYKDRRRGTRERVEVEVVNGRRNACPIPGCTGNSMDKFGMYRHFCYRHPEASVSVNGDATERCEMCGMFTTNMAKHQNTQTCKKGRTRRRNEDLQDKQAEGDKVEFKVYGETLERVKEFKYLGRILREDDDDTACIINQVKRARQKWNAIARILKREGANARIMAKFYMAVVQAVLLYGAESWVITKRNWKRLESFHNRALRYMTGQHIRKVGDEEWTYPSHEELEEKCGLYSIKEYIERRRRMLRRYLEEHRKDFLHEAMETRVPQKNVNKILWWNQE